MKLFFHFVLSNFSNTYLLGPTEGGEALIIDPGVMDHQLLDLIERNNFYIRTILVTHNHASHINGIKTLLKIYDADVYSHSDIPFKVDIKRINDGDHLDLGWIGVDIINIPGHSPDSMLFSIDNMLFTGDVLLAGFIDSDLTRGQEKELKNNIIEKIFTMPDETLIFPGHGAPTTIKSEKLFNPNFLEPVSRL